jgi:hypothetical protein
VGDDISCLRPCGHCVQHTIQCLVKYSTGCQTVCTNILFHSLTLNYIIVLQHIIHTLLFSCEINPLEPNIDLILAAKPCMTQHQGRHIFNFKLELITKRTSCTDGNTNNIFGALRNSEHVCCKIIRTLAPLYKFWETRQLP